MDIPLLDHFFGLKINPLIIFLILLPLFSAIHRLNIASFDLNYRNTVIRHIILLPIILLKTKPDNGNQYH